MKAKFVNMAASPRSASSVNNNQSTFLDMMVQMVEKFIIIWADYIHSKNEIWTIELGILKSDKFF